MARQRKTPRQVRTDCIRLLYVEAREHRDAGDLVSARALWAAIDKLKYLRLTMDTDAAPCG